MLLDINPIHHESWSCMEDIIISAASWWGLDHELMFVDAWDFVYKLPESDLGTLGERLHEGEDKTWQHLDYYHGIQITPYTTLAHPEALEVIKSELSQHRPIIIYINAYWCAWCKVYQKSSFPHTCLIIGHDGCDTFATIDPYNTSNVERLSLSDFAQGYSKHALFSVRDGGKTDVAWRPLLKAAALKMLRPVCLPGPFDMMRNFADAIETLDLMRETQGNEDLLKSLLYERIKYIIRRRLQFSQVLMYLDRKHTIANIAPLVKSFEHAAQLWEMTRNILIKFYYMPNVPAMKVKAANKIREAAEYEGRLAQALLAFSIQ